MKIVLIQGSLSYAELGTVIRKSGGEYSYIKEALGDIPAFLFAWTSVIVVRTSSMGIICLTFGEYMATFFPYCGSPVIPIKLVAALAIGKFISHTHRLCGVFPLIFTYITCTKLLWSCKWNTFSYLIMLFYCTQWDSSPFSFSPL